MKSFLAGVFCFVTLSGCVTLENARDYVARNDIPMVKVTYTYRW